jgi:hypothetical protein
VCVVPERDEIGWGGDMGADGDGDGAERAMICFVGLGIDAEASAASLSFPLSSWLSYPLLH